MEGDDHRPETLPLKHSSVMMMNPQIVVCPPSYNPHWQFDEHQFAKQALQTSFDHDGEVHAAYGHFAFGEVSFQRLKPKRMRTLDCVWSNSDANVRAVVAEYWARRAFPHSHYARTANLSPKEKLALAVAEMKKQEPAKWEKMDSLCRAFVACDDPARKEILAKKIEERDTELRALTAGPGLQVRILHAYYRMGMNACAVAELVKLKGTHVRQQLYRLRQTWRIVSTPRLEMPSAPEKPGRAVRVVRTDNERREIHALQRKIQNARRMLEKVNPKPGHVENARKRLPLLLARLDELNRAPEKTPEPVCVGEQQIHATF